MGSERLGFGWVALAISAIFGCTGCIAGEVGSEEDAPSSVQQGIPQGSVLFVVGNTTLNTGDTAINNLVASTFASVTVKSDTAATAADATGKTVVLISSTVSAANVGTKFKSVPVPVLLWESGLFDDMGMTTTANLGTATGQANLTVVAAGDPMTAGYTGVQLAASPGNTFSWGKPAASATVIAQLSTDTTKAGIFRYDAGVAMVGLNAPARRVGLYLEDTTATGMTTASRALVTAAISWAANRLCNPGTTRCATGTFGAATTEMCQANGTWGVGSACPGSASRCTMGVCVGNLSCGGLANTCGLNSNSNCCDSAIVGDTLPTTFYRGFENWPSPGQPATVSAFRLDKYEVSVGRFKKFITAWNGNWRPAAGSGKHSHLNGGGIVGGGVNYGESLTINESEPGWRAEDNTKLPSNITAWNQAYSSSSSYTGADNLPISGVSWYEAYAFCIWDSGFLPTEAEFMLAAAGGTQYRPFPWGTNEPDSSNAQFMYNGLSYGLKRVGSFSSGNGRWGHADLGGNVWEWLLDQGNGTAESSDFDPYPGNCRDCMNRKDFTEHDMRGGSFAEFNYLTRNTKRWGGWSDSHKFDVGFRCARVP